MKEKFELLATFKDNSEVVIKIECNAAIDAQIICKGYKEISSAVQVTLFNEKGIRIMNIKDQ